MGKSAPFNKKFVNGGERCEGEECRCRAQSSWHGNWLQQHQGSAQSNGSRAWVLAGSLLHLLLEERETDLLLGNVMETLLTSMHWLCPFISSWLRKEGEERPLHSFAASCVCFCHLALQPWAPVLSKTFLVLKSIQHPGGSCARSTLGSLCTGYRSSITVPSSILGLLLAGIGPTGCVYGRCHLLSCGGPLPGVALGRRSPVKRGTRWTLWHWSPLPGPVTVGARGQL